MHIHSSVMGAADVLMALVAAAMVAVLALGAAFGATRAGLGVSEARRVGRTVVLVLGAWLAVTAALAMGGALSASARPPSWPLLPLTAFAVIVVGDSLGRREPRALEHPACLADRRPDVSRRRRAGPLRSPCCGAGPGTDHVRGPQLRRAGRALCTVDRMARSHGANRNEGGAGLERDRTGS